MIRHTRSITRRQPAKAQSAYASKLLFKQQAAEEIYFHTYFLSADYSTILNAALGNLLSMGVWWTFDWNVEES